MFVSIDKFFFRSHMYLHNFFSHSNIVNDKKAKILELRSILHPLDPLRTNIYALDCFGWIQSLQKCLTLSPTKNVSGRRPYLNLSKPKIIL